MKRGNARGAKGPCRRHSEQEARQERDDKAHHQSPLSPLLANLALSDLDHILDRGSGFLSYVRYLDDMVVLTPDSEKGRAWADRALTRVRCEAEAMGVSLNADKTRLVTVTDDHVAFAFLGFEFRWVPSKRTGRYFPCMTPRSTKVNAVLRKLRDTLRYSRHLRMQAAVAQLNPILRGWVNYFRIGHSSQAFGKVKHHAELKVRRFAAKKQKQQGFGWKRWSSEVVYTRWGLFNDYRLRVHERESAHWPHGPITPMDDASAVSRMRETRLSGSTWRGPETE
jgi:RNA-directed DNA polymerase